MSLDLSRNPFRALGLSGQTSLSDLKAAVRKGIHAAKVGLAEPGSLDDVYGPADFEVIDSLVKSISADSNQLLICRLMWPAALGRWEKLGSGDSQCLLDPGPSPDSAKANYDLLKATLEADWSSRFTVWTAHQLSFVFSWILFEQSSAPKKLAQALASFTWMSSCKEAIDTLSLQSAADSGTSQADHSAEVKKAIRECALMLIEQASSKAIIAMRTGDSELGLSICQVILDSPLDDEWEERGLSSLTSFASEVCDEVSTNAEELEDWNPSWKDPLSEKVEFISALERAFGRRHPAAARWRDVLIERRETVGILMRDYAIQAYNEKSDEEEAIRVLVMVKSMEVSQKFKERIDSDLAQLAENRASGVPRVPGLTKIRSAPSMSTFNGIGAMVFDVGKCKVNPLYNYSNQYLMILLPLFPLGRYLTQPSLGGKTFYGRLPWTLGMKIHLATSCALLFVGLPLLLNSAKEVTLADPVSSSPQSSSALGQVAVESPPKPTETAEAALPDPAMIEPEEEKPPANPIRLVNGKNVLAPKRPYGLGRLTIKNKDGNADSVIILRNIATRDRAYRFVYLRSSKTVVLDRIAPGTYEVLIRQGTDWNSVDQKFNWQESLSKMDDTMEFKETKTSGGTKYSTWSLELQERVGGNASSSPLAEGEFPKK